MSTVPEYFGSLVFDDRVMKAKLPYDVYVSLKKTMYEGGSLDTAVANAVADAMKEWSGMKKRGCSSACMIFSSSWQA